MASPRPSVVQSIAVAVALSLAPALVDGQSTSDTAANGAEPTDAVLMEDAFDPGQLTEVDGVLYFTARREGEATPGLWRSDGTTSGTYPIEVCRTPLACGARRPVRSLIGTEDLLYFVTTDGLWRSDGTEAGTFMVAKDADVWNRRRSAVPRRVERERRQSERDRIQDEICLGVPLDGRLYVISERDCGDPYPQQLWASDGTVAGTRRLAHDSCGSPAFGSAPKVGTARRLFAADRGDGCEPWVTDGTSRGTRQLRDVRAGARGATQDMEGAVALGGYTLFPADDGVHGAEPWITDGTSSGTRQLTDIRPGRRGGMVGLQPPVVHQGRAFFVGNDGKHGRELWVTDGTKRGTNMVRDVRPGPDSALSRRNSVVPVGDRVYFTADQGDSGLRLWVSDGTPDGTAPAPGIPDGLTRSPRVWDLGGTAIIAIRDGDGTSLWRSEDPASDAARIGQPCDGPVDEGCWLSFAIASDGVLNIGITEQGLWRTDGTRGGTFQLEPDASWPLEPLAVDGWLYFLTDLRDADTQRLWRSDGSPGGTRSLGVTTEHYLPTSSGVFLVHGDDLADETPCWQTRCRLWFLPHDAATNPQPTSTAPRATTVDPIDGFPNHIDGRVVRARHLHGPDWVASYDRSDPDDAAAAEAIADFITSLGRELDDLRTSHASMYIGGRPTTITAVHVDGADRAELIDAIIPFLFADTVKPARERERFAGRRVIRVSDAAIPGSYPRYLYPRGDTVWLIEADKPILKEILAALP